MPVTYGNLLTVFGAVFAVLVLMWRITPENLKGPLSVERFNAEKQRLRLPEFQVVLDDLE